MSIRLFRPTRQDPLGSLRLQVGPCLVLQLGLRWFCGPAVVDLRVMPALSTEARAKSRPWRHSCPRRPAAPLGARVGFGKAGTTRPSSARLAGALLGCVELGDRARMISVGLRARQ